MKCDDTGQSGLLVRTVCTSKRTTLDHPGQDVNNTLDATGTSTPWRPKMAAELIDFPHWLPSYGPLFPDSSNIHSMAQGLFVANKHI